MWILTVAADPFANAVTPRDGLSAATCLHLYIAIFFNVSQCICLAVWSYHIVTPRNSISFTISLETVQETVEIEPLSVAIQIGEVSW